MNTKTERRSGRYRIEFSPILRFIQFLYFTLGGALLTTYFPLWIELYFLKANPIYVDIL